MTDSGSGKKHDSGRSLYLWTNISIGRLRNLNLPGVLTGGWRSTKWLPGYREAHTSRTENIYFQWLVRWPPLDAEEATWWLPRTFSFMTRQALQKSHRVASLNILSYDQRDGSGEPPSGSLEPPHL